MQVKEIMTHGIDFLDRLDTVQKAAQKMLRDNIGALPVFDSNFLVGIVTDRDITLRSSSFGKDPMKTRVCDIMTPEVFVCDQNDTIEEAALIMENRQVRRLLVTNEQKHIVGMVSLTDLAKGFNKELAAEVLKKVSSPAHPEWLTH